MMILVHHVYIIVLGYFRIRYPPSLARLDPLRLFVFRDTCFVQDATERVTSDATDVHNFAPASSGGIAGITPVLLQEADGRVVH